MHKDSDLQDPAISHFLHKNLCTLQIVGGRPEIDTYDSPSGGVAKAVVADFLALGVTTADITVVDPIIIFLVRHFANLRYATRRLMSFI